MKVRRACVLGTVLLCSSALVFAAVSDDTHLSSAAAQVSPSPAAAKDAAVRSAPVKAILTEKSLPAANIVSARAATLRDSGDCCYAHGTPGCQDPTCQDSVCSYDPYCCQYQWDSVCASEAQSDPNCDCGGGGGGPLECPPGSLYSQVPMGANDPWSAFTSAQTSAFTYKVYENYSGVTGQVCDIHWWGLNLFYNNGWFPCDPAGVTFEVTFYEAGGGGGGGSGDCCFAHPTPGCEDPVCQDSVCSYDSYCCQYEWDSLCASEAQSDPNCDCSGGGEQIGPAICTYVVTPLVTLAGNLSGYDLYYYEVPSLNPCCTIPAEGWVSIQSLPNANDCAFLWFSSYGDGVSALQDQGGSLVPVGYDVAYCLTGEYIPVFGACCDDFTGECLDNTEQIYCNGPGKRFAANTLCADLVPPCGEIPGACCHPDGTCEVVTFDLCADLWLGPNTQCFSCPCVVICPPNGVPENEPCGENYPNGYNGGCNSTPPVFEPVYCGETICGTAWADASYRDTDWFMLTLTEPSVFTWTVEAEFPVLIFIIQPGPVDPCAGYTILSSATAGECTPVSLTSPDCMMPGDYILWAGTSTWGDFPCPLDYVGTIDCVPCVISGACCDDSIPLCNENVNVLDCPAPLRFARDTACANLSPPCGGCPEATITIDVYTDPWPSETSWVVIDDVTGQVVCTSPSYTVPNALTSYTCCLPFGCYNFTIYDSYGDGIYAPGGYAIYYEGNLVFSNIGSGWSGYEQSVNQWGEGCVAHLGACCLEELCYDTLYEPDCLALGGLWYIDETCPEFVCPQTITAVTAPYVSPLWDTCTQGNDCGLRASQDHEWAVTIPYDGQWNFNLCGGETTWDTYLYLGSSRCSGDIASNDDSCGLQSQISVFLLAGLYYLTLEGYSSSGCGSYVLYIQEDVPCVLECPEGAVPEAEPCGSDTNGGCNMPVPTFEPVICNQTICGTGWFDTVIPGYRDTDWFEFVATSNDTMTWTVEAEFYMLMGVIEQIVPGQPGCDNITGYLNPYAIAQDCIQASVSFPVTAGGTYYVFVAPMFADPVYCPADYIATLTGEHCICGDFDMDGDVDVNDYYEILDAFGTCVGNPKYLPAADFDGDNCITLVDYQAWLQCYYDANGTAFKLSKVVKKVQKQAAQ